MLSKYILKMSLAPPSSLMKKSTTEAATKKGTKSNAFQESALTHSAESHAENSFLQLQITKASLLPENEKRLRLAELGQLVRKESEQEQLGRKILVKLNRLSDYDPEFAQISSKHQVKQQLKFVRCTDWRTHQKTSRIKSRGILNYLLRY